MGLGSRIFIVNDDQSIKKLSMARFERLFRRDLDERLSKYAGKRVKYAHVVVELENRKPVNVVMIQYSYLSFDAEGRIDQSSMEKEMQLGMQMMAPTTLDLKSTNVVDAEHRFARKRFGNHYLWKPSPDVKDAILNAVFGKNRSYPKI